MLCVQRRTYFPAQLYVCSFISPILFLHTRHRYSSSRSESRIYNRMDVRVLGTERKGAVQLLRWQMWAAAGQVIKTSVVRATKTMRGYILGLILERRRRCKEMKRQDIGSRGRFWSQASSQQRRINPEHHDIE